MNKRRIGLAALVVGVGAAVRRRLRTATDPGPVPDAHESTGPASAATATTRTPRAEDQDSAPAAEARTTATPGAGDATDVSIGEPDIDLPEVDDASGIPVEDVDLGEPAIELDGESETDSAESAVDADTADPAEASKSEPDPAPEPESEPDPAPEPGSEPDPAPEPEPEPDPAPEAGSDPEPKSESESDPEPEAASSPEDAASAQDVPRIVIPTMPQAGTKSGPGIDSEMRAARVAPGSSLAMGGGGVGARPGMTSSSLPASSTMAMSTTPGGIGGVGGEPLAGPRTGGVAANAASESAADPAHSPDVFTDPAPRRHRPWYRRRGWRIFGTALGAVIVAAVIAASVIQLPYYSLRPGSVYDTIERVEAPGDLVTIPNGEIGFVTVSQTANITAWQWLDAKLDGTVRIRHEDEIRGDQTADELREADIRRMQISKNSAVVVALQRLGYDLVITPIGIEVAQVFPCTAADGTLGTGDLIVGVNGEDVRDGESLIAALAEIGIGEDVDLMVERIDPTNPTQSLRTDEVTLTLGSADADCLPDDVRAEEPRAFIGIGTLTIVDEEFPIEIDVDTGSVGGPSAGLAFTLAIMDVLSEGDLTNGLKIVATGTIDRDGNVGPVGGIQQKTVAAERSGADLFLVPLCCDNFVSRSTGEPLDMKSNYEEALENAENLRVVGVETLDDALEAIGELGGDVDQFLLP